MECGEREREREREIQTDSQTDRHGCRLPCLIVEANIVFLTVLQLALSSQGQMSRSRDFMQEMRHN